MPSLQIISQIKLNVSRPNSGVVVYAKQYDMASRIIDVDLVHGSSTWDPPSESEMIVMYSKPDGTTGIYDVVEGFEAYSNEKTYHIGDKVVHTDNSTRYVYTCNTEISVPENWNSDHWTKGSAVTKAITRTGTGKVRVVLSEQALTCPGNVMISLCFYQGTTRSTTLSFILSVEKSPDDNTALKSTDYFNILSVLIEGVIGTASYPPTIDSITRNWMLWNPSTAQYEDSGYSSVGPIGPVNEVTSTVLAYAQSASGTEIPSSGWSSTLPEIEQGKYLWTRTTTNYNAGGPVISYICAYHGIDGEGSAGEWTPKGMSATGDAGEAIAYSKQDHKHPYPITVVGTVLTFPAYDTT